MRQDTRDRLNNLDRDLASSERLLQEREKDLQDLESEVEALHNEAELLDKVEKVLQAVSSHVLGQSTDTIDKLVTSGLKVVFFDQKLEFKTVVDKFRGKTSIRFELYENGKTAPLMESFGGGVVVLIGVLLRVVTIIVLGQRRILLLDESLSHLSEQYHETASTLLKKLCKELGFTIVMVTHQASFATHADLHYEAVPGKTGTEFKKLK